MFAGTWYGAEGAGYVTVVGLGMAPKDFPWVTLGTHFGLKGKNNRTDRRTDG